MKVLSNFEPKNTSKYAAITALTLVALALLTITLSIVNVIELSGLLYNFPMRDIITRVIPLAFPSFFPAVSLILISLVACVLLSFVKKERLKGVNIAAICVILLTWIITSMLSLNVIEYVEGSRLPSYLNDSRVFIDLLKFAPNLLLWGSVILIFALFFEKANSPEAKKATVTCFVLIIGFAFASALMFVIDQAVLNASGFELTNFNFNQLYYGGYYYKGEYYTQDAVYIYSDMTGVTWLYGRAIRCFLPQVFRILLNIAMISTSSVIINKKIPRFTGVENRCGKKAGEN